jgi:predicted Fe-S protein YdhL (DUF1289 family)
MSQQLEDIMENDLSQMTDEELTEFIRALRQRRTVVRHEKKTTKKSKKPAKGASKPTSLEKLLEAMSDAEKEEFLRRLEAEDAD